MVSAKERDIAQSIAAKLRVSPKLVGMIINEYEDRLPAVDDLLFTEMDKPKKKRGRKHGS